MIVKLLTTQHLELLSLTGGCRGSSEHTLVKMPHCWKSHDTAQLLFTIVHGLFCCLRVLMRNDYIVTNNDYTDLLFIS